MENKENAKNQKVNNLEDAKPKENINFFSKVKNIQDNSLKNKVKKIENRNKIKKEKSERKNNSKSRKMLFNVLIVIAIILIILIVLFSTIVDTKEMLKNIKYSNNISFLNKKLEKIITEKSKEEGFKIESLNSKILAYDTDGFYINLVDELYDYKNEYTLCNIAILNGKLVYMGNDEKFRQIAEKKGIQLDYTLLDYMYMDNSEFKFNEETRTIESYEGNYEMIVIPSKINEIPVEKIGAYAFSSKNISVVIMPDTITTIEYSAFANNKIYYINFPSSLETIGDYAFYKNNIVSLSLGENIKEIGKFAFASNEITSIDIKSEDVMYGAASFNQNYLPEEKAYIYRSYKENDKYEIISYGGTSKDITIPEGVVKIGDYAFCKFDLGINKYNEITSLNMPNSLKIIEESAFKNNRIVSLNIPSSVGYIGRAAFKNNSISNLEISNKENTFFGVECFNNNNLSTDDAFIITLNPVTEDLINIDYDGSTFVLYLDENIVLSENEIQSENILDKYKTSQRTLVSYGGKNKDKVIIPYSVINIAYCALADSNIKEIEISSSIEKIDYNSFVNNNLTNVVIPSNVQSIGYKAFANNNISELVINGKNEIPESFDESIKEVTDNIVFN